MSKLHSLINKIKDLIKLDINHNFRLKLINELASSKTKNKYDYGEGYFYQSLESIALSGLRNTNKRIKQYDINRYIKDAAVLDIGSNIGSILIEQNKYFKKGVGIEYNENLHNISNLIKDYLDIKNINFICNDFLNYKFLEKFNVILSLANHSTYDKGIDDTKKYFSKCYDLLTKEGIIIIESHHPNYENPYEFFKMIKKFKKMFNMYEIRSGKLTNKDKYDYGRNFFILKKLL
jgi:cyclopropane fatty-acyl-phospholipid synthase-like methyltransferase